MLSSNYYYCIYEGLFYNKFFLFAGIYTYNVRNDKSIFLIIEVVVIEKRQNTAEEKRQLIDKVHTLRSLFSCDKLLSKTHYQNEKKRFD